MVNQELARRNAVELGWHVAYYKFVLTIIGKASGSDLNDQDRQQLGILKDRFDNLLAFFNLHIDVKYPMSPEEARLLFEKDLNSVGGLDLANSVGDALRINQGSDISNLFSLGEKIEIFGLVSQRTEPELRQKVAEMEMSIRDAAAVSGIPQTSIEELLRQPDRLMDLSWIRSCLFNTSISSADERTVGGGVVTKPKTVKTILILAANPKNTDRIRLEQEIRDIENGLERAQRRDEFTLKQKLAARPQDVRRAMMDYDPAIVHFCGHGSGDEGIVFEDDDGQALLVNNDALSGLFKLFVGKVECVVLNACYSEKQAKAIVKHIPYVIGMKKAVGDPAAIEFAVAFYDALGAGESIEFAYKLACNALQWKGIPEHLTPVLKIKTKL